MRRNGGPCGVRRSRIGHGTAGVVRKSHLICSSDTLHTRCMHFRFLSCVLCQSARPEAPRLLHTPISPHPHPLLFLSPLYRVWGINSSLPVNAQSRRCVRHRPPGRRLRHRGRGVGPAGGQARHEGDHALLGPERGRLQLLLGPGGHHIQGRGASHILLYVCT